MKKWSSAKLSESTQSVRELKKAASLRREKAYKFFTVLRCQGGIKSIPMVLSNSDGEMEDLVEQKSASTSHRKRIVSVVSLSLAALGVTLVVSGSKIEPEDTNVKTARRKLLNDVKTAKGHVEGEIDWLNRGIVGGPTKSPSAGLHKPTWKPSFKPVESADIIALNPRTIGLGGMKGENHKWEEKEILHVIPTHNMDEKKISVTEDVVTTDVTTTNVVVTEDVTVPPVVDVTLNDVITTFTASTGVTSGVATTDNTVAGQDQFVRSLIKDPPPGSKGALSPPMMQASRPEAVVDVKHGGIAVDTDVTVEIDADAAAADAAAATEAEEKAAEEKAAEEAAAAEAAKLKEEEDAAAAAAKEAAEKEEEEEKEKEEEAAAAAAEAEAEKLKEEEEEEEAQAEKEKEKEEKKIEEAEKEAEKAAKKLKKEEKKAEKEAAAAAAAAAKEKAEQEAEEVSDAND